MGTAVLAGVNHAGLWTGSGAAFSDLHPNGVASSSLANAHRGVQVGSAGGPGIWFGSSDSFYPLAPYLPPEYASAIARDVYVADDGTITVAGSGYHSGNGRSEAIIWRSLPGSPGDLNCDGVVSVADIGAFVLVLTNPAEYASQFPDCDALNGDLNGDGAVTVSDIGLFVALLTGA